MVENGISQKSFRITKNPYLKKNFMLKALLNLYGLLPLKIVHGFGVLLGLGLRWFSVKYARRLRKHLAGAGYSHAQNSAIEHAAFAEAGKAILETPLIWFKPLHKTLSLVKAVSGWDAVEKATLSGKGIIFLTPHFGCYEITSLYYGSLAPITVLYRPPRKASLEPLLVAGRARGQVSLAPTNMQGVRKLLKALKQGEAIGILPDQVPEPNEGEWADFFGRPAYTMNLATKLAASTGAQVLMAYGERLPRGEGYHIHITPLEGEPTPANINKAIEQLIARNPAQYLWAYRRYKQP